MVVIEVKKGNLIVLLCLLLILTSSYVIYAYNGGFSGGNPVVAGHSSDEINVRVGTSIKTLQSAIDEGDFQGRSVDIGVVTPGEGTINIGAGRDCVAFVKDYFNNCRADGFHCRYDSSTGEVLGAGGTCGGSISCMYVCFD
jgi:hypothetical protein